MTAPALVLLAPTPYDSRSVHANIEMTRLIKAQRPDIFAHPAFVHDVVTVIDHLAENGHTEVVVVPSLLAGEDPHGMITAVHTCSTRRPDISIVLADPLGLEPELLNIVDERMRAALAQFRVRELDALVLTGPGTVDSAANAAMTRAARVWGKQHHLPTIAAFGAHIPPTVHEAVRSHRADGRRHIAVGRMFLSASELCDQVGELAYCSGAIAVSDPLGAHRDLAQLVLTRYSVGSLQLLPMESASAIL